MSFEYRKQGFGDATDTKLYLGMIPLASKTGEFEPPASGITGTISVTGVGFRPDAIVLFTGRPRFDVYSMRACVGCATSTSSDEQWSLAVRGGYLDTTRNKVWAPGHCFVWISGDPDPAHLPAPDPHYGYVTLAATLDSFDADGFTLDFDVNVAGQYRPPGGDGSTYAISYLALQGDFRAGVGSVGSDINLGTMLGFRPKGIWTAHARCTGAQRNVVRQGWDVGQGFSARGANFSMNGGGRDPTDQVGAFHRSSSFITNADCIVNFKPADASGLTDVDVISRARVLSFTDEGASLWWQGDPEPIYEYGYLLCGEQAEAGFFNFNDGTVIDGSHREIASLLEPTAMLMTARGNGGSTTRSMDDGTAIVGGIGCFSFGSVRAGVWHDVPESPPEEYFCCFGEETVNPIGGVGSSTQVAWTRGWQVGSWAHTSDVIGGFPTSEINIMETAPGLMPNLNWRSSDRRAGGLFRGLLGNE